jgi:hypothetical protein
MRGDSTATQRLNANRRCYGAWSCFLASPAESACFGKRRLRPVCDIAASIAAAASHPVRKELFRFEFRRARIGEVAFAP